MFTGIVEEVGVVKSVDFFGNVNKLKIECKGIFEDIRAGESISVNGICLTVCNLGNNWFEADVMPETLRKTNLGILKQGDKVNLELALRLDKRLGGHIITGHIDGIGMITCVRQEENAVWIVIEVPEDIIRYIVNKGSVAVEGVSLTVARIEDKAFGVSLIPATCLNTVLGDKKVRDKVNIECDIIAKYAEKLLNMKDKKQSNIDIGFLEENGFI